MANNVSTMGQQLSLITRFKKIQTDMAQYQQQVSTGIKYQNFKDYGADALRIQRYRADLVDIEGYVYNINIAKTNIQQMDSAISETIEQAGNVLSAITIQLTKGQDFDVSAIRDISKTALQLVQANMNTKIGDRYLFSGTDVSNEPYTGSATVTAGVKTRTEDWLDGTTTTDDFLAGIKGMTDTQLGYSQTLQSAKSIFARADDNFEVDYTVLASDTGFSKLVAGLNTLSQLTFPTEGTDTPTKDEFYTALNSLYQIVQSGVEDLRQSSGKVASAAQTITTIADNHLTDKQNLQQVLETTEAADVTDAVVRFQALQTQLEASFRVTAILSQLSLTRFLS